MLRHPVCLAKHPKPALAVKTCLHLDRADAIHVNVNAGTDGGYLAAARPFEVGWQIGAGGKAYSLGALLRHLPNRAG